MRTEIPRDRRVTTIQFDEKSPWIWVQTYNTSLKKRLTRLNADNNTICLLLADDPEIGCKEFRVRKGRLCFRITEPYSEERRQTLSRNATANGFQPTPASDPVRS